VLSERNPNVKFKPFDQIDKAPEEKARGITIAISHVEYDNILKCPWTTFNEQTRCLKNSKRL
jgi:translation elongation factor EF-Tu-like GTPase